MLLPLWNSYSFFVTYANVDNWNPGKGEPLPPAKPSNPLDRWILSSLTQMVEEIGEEMDLYHLQKAANRFEKFIEDLTNWYIRRSRRRFWKSQNDSDKQEAYQTLHYALLTFVKTAAPFIPFVTEEIYRNLRTQEMPESVHLCEFPKPDKAHRAPELERQMEAAMTATSLGRFLRTQHTLKVRQPLRKTIIVAGDTETRRMLEGCTDIIAEELNVKEIVFSANEEELVTLSAKANFKALGPRLGPVMKEAATRITSLTTQQTGAILRGESFSLDLSTGPTEITREYLTIQRTEKEGLCVATEGGITVALDTVLDDALRKEGFAREFVNRIQNLRKELGLEVADRIHVRYSVPSQWKEALCKFSDYIRNETLAEELSAAAELPDAHKTDVNGEECLITITKLTR